MLSLNSLCACSIAQDRNVRFSFSQQLRRHSLVQRVLEKLVYLNLSLYPHLEVKIQSDEFYIKLESAISLALIINELITNSAKHGCSDDGIARVSLFFTLKNDKAVFTVIDEGQGFPQGLEIDQLSSFGMVVVDLLAKQIGGSLIIENENGGKVSVIYPLGNDFRNEK